MLGLIAKSLAYVSSALRKKEDQEDKEEKESASEASRGVVWGGERVRPPWQRQATP